MKINLTKPEMYEAVRDGVKAAILEMTETEHCTIQALVLAEIRSGVFGAMEQFLEIHEEEIIKHAKHK